MTAWSELSERRCTQPSRDLRPQGVGKSSKVGCGVGLSSWRRGRMYGMRNSQRVTWEGIKLNCIKRFKIILK